MLIKVFGAAVQGIDATLITIEVNSSRGCMFYLVACRTLLSRKATNASFPHYK